MNEVYFSKELDKILENVDFSNLGNNVAIKVHFGEKGCETYLSPLIVKKVYDKVISLGNKPSSLSSDNEKKAALVECNVLYRGSRTNATDHTKTAMLHGFDFAPIDILDGEMGNEDIDVKVENGIVSNAKLGAGLKKYDSLIVLTHFKGHMMSGFGGAIKNIGMGLGSRAGKLAMHSNLKPSVNAEKCISCGKCIDNCDVKAISFDNGRAKINDKICIGCAMCIAVCPQGAVSVPWRGGTSEELQKKMVDYASAVLKVIPNTIFINFLVNITKDCDCVNVKQKPLMKDIGILYSKDIVAIDKASFDLADKESEGSFNKINEVDKTIQIDYAFSKGMGEKKYKLIELD